MVALGDGRWMKELVLPPGRYEYLYVVDGRWQPDPGAAERVPNPFGGENGVLIVAVDQAPTEEEQRLCGRRRVW